MINLILGYHPNLFVTGVILLVHSRRGARLAQCVHDFGVIVRVMVRVVMISEGLGDGCGDDEHLGMSVRACGLQPHTEDVL